MSLPILHKIRIGAYIAAKLIAGKRRFPLVLMLEPLFRCNLNCKGCGKISHPKAVLDRMLSVDECLSAAKECGAPVISIAGGEPLLHPEISRLVAEFVARKYFVYLCTNALLLKKRINEFTPSPYLNFSVHLDGFRERHDELVCCAGVFEKAVAAIRMLRDNGFRVTTNTTLFNEDTPENISMFFDYLTSLGVDGMMMAPAFSYEAASDQNHFLKCKETQALFDTVLKMGQTKNWCFNHSALYLQFLTGKRQYDCSPWGNPTRNIFGWQQPCYLLSDSYVDTYRELMENTNWEKYGRGRDPRCNTCMVHCGFEPSAVMDEIMHPWKSLKRYH